MHQNPRVMSKSNTLRKNSVLTKISKKKKEKSSYLEEEVRKRNKKINAGKQKKRNQAKSYMNNIETNISK